MQFNITRFRGVDLDMDVWDTPPPITIMASVMHVLERICNTYVRCNVSSDMSCWLRNYGLEL